MKQIQHPSNNDVLRPPPGMSIEECRPMAITRVNYMTGMPGVWSYWQPTEAERVAIAAGAPIRLEFIGRTHAPVYVGVDGVE